MAPEYVSQTEKISISIPSSLIEMIDHLGMERGYSRSGFIRKAVENQLLVECRDRQSLAELYHRLIGE